jgi:eukaryotic-like serine/threonine-protein kinase
MTGLPPSTPDGPPHGGPVKAPLLEQAHAGAVVGGYRVETRLGAGGFGQVLLAWRDGNPYALKFLHLERVGEWGWRELLILASLDSPHVVKLRSHFKWPEAESEYLVLVMEYVPGVTLFQWARQHNPCARQVARMLLSLTQALQAVHAAGVLHRDLKGDNVLVREGDGQPVLVDFGAGALPNAPSITQGGLAPGNLRYRTPEAVRFFLRPVRTPGERYAYGVKDELYALGVVLYLLLTDVYPFDGPDDELLAELVASAPEPPCEVDSRVPGPLSDLCLRLLAREPAARLPSTQALGEALVSLLTKFQGDAAWDVPLCDGWAQDGRTTDPAPELGGNAAQARMRRWVGKRPKRGEPPRAPVLPAAVEPPVPRSVPPVRAQRRWRASVLRAVGGVAVGSVALLHVLGPRVSTPLIAQGALTRTLPEHVPDGVSPPWAPRRHEVAPPWKPLEADAGAAPPKADTPAPVTTVTLRTGTPRMKKKAAAQPETDTRSRDCAGANTLLAVAAAANLACPGVQVRKEPAPQACPAGAVETMTRQLGIPLGQKALVEMPGKPKRNSNEGVPVYERVPVKEGPVSLELDGDWDTPPYDRREHRNTGPTALPDLTRLIGRLYIGEKRVYGRITQAVTPSGDTFTVCMELIDQSDLIEGPGVTIEPGSGSIKVWLHAYVVTVDHFE